MGHDEVLCGRVRKAVGEGPGVSERRMFGGVAFLVEGNMAVAASGQGGLLVRVDPTEADALLASTPAERMVMRGRPLQGWLRVESADVGTARALRAWVDRGVAYARTLPPKS